MDKKCWIRNTAPPFPPPFCSPETVMMILDPVEPGPGCGPDGGRPHGGFLRSPLQGVLLAHRPLHRLGTH
jgi:hypothetical protein